MDAVPKMRDSIHFCKYLFYMLLAIEMQIAGTMYKYYGLIHCPCVSTLGFC